MKNKNKRILWLLNHTTLRAFEVPLLMRLGFEVFTPKIIPNDIAERSGSVTFEYDHTLSLPEDIVHALNTYDFYQAEVEPDIFSLFNQYFGHAVLIFHTPLIKTFSKH